MDVEEAPQATVCVAERSIVYLWHNFQWWYVARASAKLCRADAVRPVALLFNDLSGMHDEDGGFFHHYNAFSWTLVVGFPVAGLSVAGILKHLDNIAAVYCHVASMVNACRMLRMCSTTPYARTSPRPATSCGVVHPFLQLYTDIFVFLWFRNVRPFFVREWRSKFVQVCAAQLTDPARNYPAVPAEPRRFAVRRTSSAHCDHEAPASNSGGTRWRASQRQQDPRQRRTAR